MRRRRRAVVAAGVVGLIAISGVVVALVRYIVDDPAATVATPDDGVVSREVPTAESPDDTARPTADASGSGRANEDLVVIESAWTLTDFGEVQTLVLIGHRGSASFANVVARVGVIDGTGTEVEALEYSFRRIEAGEITPATGFVETPVDDIASLSVTINARGTVPAVAPIEFDDVEWIQDDIGTVTVTGVTHSESSHEFAALVAVLRDGDGAFAGAAFGVVDAADTTARPFELVGFPPGRIEAIELYAAT